MKDYSFLSNIICSHFIEKTEFSDIHIGNIGYEECSLDKLAINSIIFPKKDFLLHYIISGTGFFKNDFGKYELKAGDVFSIAPDTSFEYMQHNSNPWSYFWIEFSGTCAKSIYDKAGFSLKNPIFTTHDDKLKDILAELLDKVHTLENIPAIVLAQYPYLIFSYITNTRFPQQTKNETSKKSVTIDNRLIEITQYINANYANPIISLDFICKKFHFNNSYLSKLFHKEIGVTISHYIINLRLSKARDLLTEGKFMVKEVASNVGYDDVFFFSKQFKKQFGITPKLYYEKREYIFKKDIK